MHNYEAVVGDLNQFYELEEQFLQQLLAVHPSDQVARRLCVDLGCGVGAHCRAALRLGYSVVGVDIDPDALAFAAKELTTVAGSSMLVVGDLEALPLHMKGRAALVLCLGNVVLLMSTEGSARALLLSAFGSIDQGGTAIIGIKHYMPTSGWRRRADAGEHSWERVFHIGASKSCLEISTSDVEPSARNAPSPQYTYTLLRLDSDFVAQTALELGLQHSVVREPSGYEYHIISRVQ